MELIYKICSACNGLGEVPFIPQVKPGESSETEPGSSISCGRCGGDGYVPTGEFIPVVGQKFLKQLETVTNPITVQIIKNKI